MASFVQRLRTLVKAEANDLLDKKIDSNSLPMLRQYIRDLEDGIETTKSQAAKAAASVTTLSRQKGDIQHNIEHDTQIAQAYLSQKNEAAARQVATRIHGNQQQVTTLEQQIVAAREQSQQLDKIVEQLNTKHTEVVSELNDLQIKENSAKSISQATQSLKAASVLTSNDVGSSIDNLKTKINAKSDLAQEEFKRTVGTFDTPSDPIKDAEVDDILNSLRPASSATA